MASISTTPFAIHDTEKGVRIDLTIYYYPDSHGNLLDAAGENYPVANDNELHGNLVAILEQAKRQMKKRGLKVK